MGEQATNEAMCRVGDTGAFARSSFQPSNISHAASELEPPSASTALDEVEAARAQEYALLSVLLARAPDARLLARLAQLRADPSPLGLAHGALAQAASSARIEAVERE